MIQIAVFIALTLAGVAAGRLSGLNPITQSFFPAFTSFALVVGLYGSVVGIDLEAVRRRKWLALTVVTVAVPVKVAVTGLVMYLIYPHPISFLASVALTQIDPLSVDTLLRDKEKMSAEAQGILRIWASFDDPVTVLFGFLILMPLVSGVSIGVGTGSYAMGLLLNLGPAAVLWGLSRWTGLLHRRAVGLVLLAVTLTLAFVTGSYLLAAITGLLLRPIPEKYLSRVVAVLYHAIVFVVGMAIYSYGVDLRLGVLLAIVEFCVIQPLSTIAVYSGTTQDLLRIAYSQQNGLTTLLMGIAFQELGFGALQILLPAIVAVNLLNLAVNKLYSWKEARGLIK